VHGRQSKATNASHSAQVFEATNNNITTLNAQDKIELEQLIDRTSIEEIINALVDICYVKAQHVETNLHDAKPAMLWKKQVSEFLTA
jgi:hypothetical protein